jgi:glycosyltransferase involved in cell wall biosynthesis
MLPLHIAFLTPEFPTEVATEGGLANYLYRMTRSLVDAGHSVEVFTLSERPEESFDFEGAWVHRVRRASDWAWLAAWSKVVRGPLSIAATRLHVRGALALAQALEWREQVSPFDIVQTSNYGLTGLFVPRLSNRRHLARCGSSNALTREANGVLRGIDGWYGDRLERRAFLQADRVYAPSRFVARDYGRRFDVDVQVVRPPLFLDAEPGSPPAIPLPPRYLMYFGYIGRIKGTDVLAQALKKAWSAAPDLRMVWAGTDHHGHLPGFRRMWGEHAANVTWCGPLRKAELYAVVRKATASVAPTRCDNLPNTVLESLQLGVPVIGSQGASIDEIIEPGVQGTLVPVGDAAQLARSLVAAWRGAKPFDGRAFPLPAIFDEMQPARAVKSFLELAEPLINEPVRRAA